MAEEPEIQFTPDNALPDIRVLTISVGEDGEVECGFDDFSFYEARGLLHTALRELDRDEDDIDDSDDN